MQSLQTQTSFEKWDITRLNALAGTGGEHGPAKHNDVCTAKVEAHLTTKRSNNVRKAEDTITEAIVKASDVSPTDRMEDVDGDLE